MTAQDEQRPIKAYPDSLGANPHSGGVQELGGLVPPYEGRKTDTSRDDAEAMASVYSVDYSNPAPRREISKTERKGVTDTDPTGATPLGVGESKGRQGNKKALKWSEEKRRKDKEEYGISRTKPIDPESPSMQAGDQGG